MTEHTTNNIFIPGPIAAGFIADSIQKHSKKTTIGGHSIFLGQVRADTVNDKNIVAIDYTANEALALEIMRELRETIFAKYALTCMHVYHSLGLVNTGELCLFVFTSSQHRKAAIDACEETVEKIKTTLPVWGRELFEDDTHRWKVNI